MKTLQRAVGKAGISSASAGLGAVTEIGLTMPATAPPGKALTTIAQNSAPPLRIDEPGAYRLHLLIASLAKKLDLQISLQSLREKTEWPLTPET